MRRAEKITAAVVIGLAVVALLALLMLTQTNWGRRHVLAIGLDQLASRVHGKVSIANIHGNLLSGARLDNVVITDTAGRPFLRADTLTIRYSLRSLVRKHLELHDVRIVNGIVVLDQPPGEEWNFTRIFPTGPPRPHRGPGFGSWIIIRNLSVHQATVIVRATWTPADTLRGAARERAIAHALAPANRMWIVPAYGGYQSISGFYNVYGRFPLMRLADPDSANRIIDVRALSMLALPFRPPGARVRSLSAHAVITQDSLRLERVHFLLPHTQGNGSAAYALNGDGARVQLNLPQAAAQDARFIFPDAPTGSGRLALAFTSRRGRTHVIASDMDVRGEGAHVRGRADFQTGHGEFLVGPSDLSFTGVSTRLINRYSPSVPLKAPGTLAGDVHLHGTPAALRVDGKVAFDEAGGPTSHIVADGEVGQQGGAFVARGLRLRFRPLYLSLVRKYAPGVPYRGAITGVATLTGTSRSGFALNADVIDADPRAGRSHILANGRVELRDGGSVRGLRLRFAPLQVAMARVFAPTLPYEGTIAGTTTLTGSQRRGFDIVADVTHTSEATGSSHITANGWIKFVNGITARSLRLGFSPLQVAMLRPYAPDLPVDGTLVGRTTITGATGARRMAGTLDLEHHASTGVSHFVGRADVNWAGRGRFDVAVRAPVLSLATAGRFLRGAGLHGTASGTIVARGRLANLTTDVNLAIADDNGTIHTRGVFDLSGAVKRYDFTSTVSAFNAGAVTTHAPATRLTGTVIARGAGTTAATANAFIDARLVGSRAAGSPLVDTALVQARLANGLVTFEQGRVRLGSARAAVSGSFGLSAARSGTLHYSLDVDTISQFLAHVPVDTGTIRPRPLPQARRLAQARADSARIAEATAVQRAAVGYPPPPRLVKPAIPPLRRDTLAGSLRAEGTLTGNVKRFDARGTAQARHFSYGANYVGLGNATYTLTGFGTPDASVHLDALGDTVSFSGFAFDSARAKLDYTGVRDRGAGTADVALFQDPARDYLMRSDFTLALDRKQAVLQTLTLRFDTTKWQALHPAAIGWGKPGVTVANLELRSNTDGYLHADGRLPTNGSADLRLDVEKLQLGDVSGLLQATADIEGLLDLHATWRGTTRAPVIAGDATLASGRYRGTALPDIKSTLSYANRDLTLHTELFRSATRLAVADAHLPVDLALADRSGPRVLRTVPLQVDVRADSLPLEALPSFTTAVSDVRGRVRGNAAIRGTFNDPSLNGLALLDLGTLRVNSTGVLYHDIVGTVRLRGDTAYVDSIVAYAGGSVRTTGTIDFGTLSRPGFDLRMRADNAVLVDNERGTIRADAALAVKGPYDGVHVTGAAQVRSGVMYAPETRNRRVTNLDDPTLRANIDTAGLGLDVLPRPNPLMSNLQVDVNVRISPDTWARNTQANVEIYTPEDGDPLIIHMDNARQVLTLTGIINTDRGEYTFAGRNFQLTTGSVTFMGDPGINPLLQLTARYQVQRRGVEALVIEVHVDGSLREPRVTLQSNSQPPLAQSDLLSYLAFGQSSSSVLNMQSTSMLGIGNGGLTGIPALAEQQLASVAIGASIESAVAQIQREGSRSGLDVFRVHAGELPAEAAFQGYFQNLVRGTEIEAGKYIMPRLFLEARGRLSTTPGVQLQYRGPLGVTWNGVWEPRYMPLAPSFSESLAASRVRSLGVLLLWSRRY